MQQLRPLAAVHFEALAGALFGPAEPHGPWLNHDPHAKAAALEHWRTCSFRASLYVYLANTAELHAAILEELLGAVDLGPVSAAGDWRDRLAAVLDSYTRVLFEHTGATFLA